MSSQDDQSQIFRILAEESRLWRASSSLCHVRVAALILIDIIILLNHLINKVYYNNSKTNIQVS